MRPDEHKRRKNEQYKKKHGLKSSAGKQSIAKQTETGTAPPTIVAKVSTDSKILTPEDPELDVQKPTFQRRKIESNWDRYDDLPISEQATTVIGADFREILNAASTAVSQFRFKDEEEWGSAVPDGVERTANPLSVNCEALSNSISCVPLHQRLRIDTGHFTQTQVNKFSEHAKRQQILADSSVSDQSSSENTSCSEQYKEKSRVNNLKTSDGNTVDSCGVPCSSQGSNIQEVNDRVDVQGTSNCDELDDLLDIEPSRNKPASNSINEQLHSNSINTSTTDTCATNTADDDDDDLDMLLNIETQKKPPSVVASAVVASKTTTENLEDWLDSVLED